MGIITYPRLKKGITPLSQLIKILGNIYEKIYLISGFEEGIHPKFENNVKFIDLAKITIGKKKRISKYIRIQFQILKSIINLNKRVDSWIFFIGGESLIIPMIYLKLSNKKQSILIAGDPSKGQNISKDKLSKIQYFLSLFGFFLCNNILVYSKKIIHQRNLQKFIKKTYVVKRHFIDLEKFNDVPINNREFKIGFLGAIHKLKGIEQLIQGVAKFMKFDTKYEFLIAGDGDEIYVKDIEEKIRKTGFQDRIKLLGWIPYQKVPNFLSSIRLLILPSLTEGLPNVILEAMASGTIVLATKVGAIEDVILHKKNGFLLEDNSPERIQESISHILDEEDIGKISKNARNWIDLNYNYEKSIESFTKIKKSLTK